MRTYTNQQFKQAATWFVRLQSEQCSEQDQQLFNVWIAKNPAHSAAYNKAEQLWGNFDNLKSLDIPALNEWTANNSVSTKTDTHWLAAFADSTLTALVSEAITHNYDLKATAARVKAAHEQAVIDGAPRLPQLAVAPEYQRGKLPNTETTRGFNLIFDLSWEIDLWGRIRASQQASEQEAGAAAADFQAAHLSLVARTAQSYFDLIEAELQVVVAEQSIKDRRIIADLIRGRFTRGLTGGLDLRLVLTDVANAEAQLATARNQVQLVSRRLETLLGRYPGGQLQQQVRLAELPVTIAAGLPAELLTRRPDIVAAFNRLQAMDARVFSARQAAFREVEQALSAEQWLRAQEQALKEAVEQTEASRKLAVYAYSQGLIQILTLLDSYRSTFTAQSEYLTVQRQLLNNRINLYLALGGGV